MGTDPRHLSWAVAGAALAVSLLPACARRETWPSDGVTGIAPTIATVQPASGPAAGGSAVTITGSGFATGAAVRFGTTLAASATVADAGTIVVVTPVHAQGTFDVVVTNSGGLGAVRPWAYTFIGPAGLPPLVTGIAPGVGPTGGSQTVTITGVGFDPAATVTIGGTAAGMISNASATMLIVQTPTGTLGPADVTVINPSAPTDTLRGGFVYVAAPTITAIAPTSGPTLGDTPFLLTGTGFLPGAVVQIGSTPAAGVQVLSGTTLVARAPAGSLGARNVSVVLPGNLVATLGSGYTYTTPGTAPSISSIAPTSGPSPGGVTVTVSGTGFALGATLVVGGLGTTSVTTGGSTQLTAVTPRIPPGVVGALDAALMNPGGDTGVLVGAYTPTAVALESATTSWRAPQVAVDGAGRIHTIFVVRTGGSGTVYYTQSTDGGQTWAAAASLGMSTAGQPRIATRGSLVAVVVPGSTLATSTDAGQTWSTQTVAAGGGTGWNVLDVDVAIGSNSTIVLASHESYSGGWVYDPPSSAPGSVRIGTGSAGGSFSWQTLTSGQAAIGALGVPAVAADGSGVVLVAWSDALAGGLVCARSTDDAGSFGSPTTLAPIGTAVSLWGRPDMDLQGGVAAVAWLRQDTGHAAAGWLWSVRCRLSGDGGATWAGEQDLAPAQPMSGWIWPYGPGVAVDAAGGATVCWAVRASQFAPVEVWSRWAPAAGVFAPAISPTAARGGSAEDPAVAAGAFAFHVWVDDAAASGTFDVVGY